MARMRASALQLGHIVGLKQLVDIAKVAVIVCEELYGDDGATLKLSDGSVARAGDNLYLFLPKTSN